MSTKKLQKVLIGAHTSASGGAFHALEQGAAIGATTIQLFTSNQKQWKSRSISAEEVERWETTLHATHIDAVMSHASYLINLGSPDRELLDKSQQAFAEEIKRCHLFNIPYLNFHPGAAKERSERECLDGIIESLLMMTALCREGKTRLLLETTAGQGTSVGHKFSHLSYIIEGVKKDIDIGVCIDTCHVFAAGYDIRNEENWEETLDCFDTEIGLEHLYAFHLNDSQHPLGSRKDRHAELGKGCIGMDAFRILMQHPKTALLPKYLETPSGLEGWAKEIALLKRFAKEG